MPILNELSEIARRLLNPETHKLYCAGIINKENELTDLGREILEALLVEEKLDELVEEADKILKKERKS